ncbi:hypothetical protein ACFODZ_13245 [Marinicella sediminis]|uniref:Uncharacterized protein n=1 Tax=Marinicella sediminis TaxID=1792834 RepID=A0ABV7JDF5_9GAMM|nr:hypothetical protein [Marinicella sediminis]
MKKTTLLLMLMLCSMPSWSFTPESGLYWNSDEPGSGYNFEIQDNFFFGVFYVYDDLGLPYWYTTSGFIDGNAFFEGDLYISEDGPCLACDWQPATTFDSGLGKVRIDFLTETTATMELLGQQIFIERFNFFLGNELDKMRGEWQVVMDASEYTDGNPFYGDVLVFEQSERIQGVDMVTGCRAESTVYYVTCTDDARFYNSMAAIYDPVNERLEIVVDDDDDHWLLYVVYTGTRQFDGAAYYYEKGTDPLVDIENGYLTRGFRSASKSFIDSGVGPNKKTPATNQSAPRSVGLPHVHGQSGNKSSKSENSTSNRELLENYLLQQVARKKAAQP